MVSLHLLQTVLRVHPDILLFVKNDPKSGETFLSFENDCRAVQYQLIKHEEPDEFVLGREVSHFLPLLENIPDNNCS